MICCQHLTRTPIYQHYHLSVKKNTVNEYAFIVRLSNVLLYIWFDSPYSGDRVYSCVTNHTSQSHDTGTIFFNHVFAKRTIRR